MKKYGTIIWVGVLAAITAFLIVPATNHIFETASAAHPFLMGFIKFAILASMGELLAARIAGGQWVKTKGFIAKAIAWGVIGIMVTFMFKFYPNGVLGSMDSGLLIDGEGFMHTFFFGFFTSFFMNVTFGPVFMTLHRISDRYIEEKVDGNNPSIKSVIEQVDWAGFILNVVAKTVPFFWIPMHTLTFFLPAEYRVIVAAYLSICLGIILSMGKKNKVCAATH